MSNPAFTDAQKQYLQGFVAGADLQRHNKGLGSLAGSLPILNNGGAAGVGEMVTVGTSGGPDAMHHQAQDRFIAAGKKLNNEEKAKREKNALDIYDELVERAKKGEFPKGTDVFLTKFHGLFYVAPAQDSYMCRMRLPGGLLKSHQLRGVAQISNSHAGGYAHVTTRANLQIREIPPTDTIHVLNGLADLGIITRGAGGDNLRNITASPTAGIDSQELIDTSQLAKDMHHYILQHREMYGLPRKFNIAFDGGGKVSSVADTNDVAFMAVKLEEENATADFPAGIYFRLELGGITGHKDFARDTGIMLKPDQCVEAAAAVVKCFIENGDRTDRKKARLKYLLDDWGFEKFIAECQKHLTFDWPTFELAKCTQRSKVDRLGHVDFHPQKQADLHYVGVTLPVGKLEQEQMFAIADIADRFGNGDIRLTVWQNLLIPNIPTEKIDAVKEAIEAAGLHWSKNNLRAGLIACTGNNGCKFAASDTKRHAMLIAEHVENTVALDSPVNIHVTGCHHSCAQHYIGDIGLMGASVSVEDDMVEGYHMYLGGGYGENQGIARDFFQNVQATDAPAIVEQLLTAYMNNRTDDAESFAAFCNRHEIEALKAYCAYEPAAA
ncbi:MAG: NirA family protein [Phycisphaeraceae bacterium JB051]